MHPIKRKSGKHAATAAITVLHQTNNPAVGYGDIELLHLIADELNWPHNGILTEKQILNAIDRNHKNLLIKRYYTAYGSQPARIFYLPGKEPQK